MNSPTQSPNLRSQVSESQLQQCSPHLHDDGNPALMSNRRRFLAASTSSALAMSIFQCGVSFGGSSSQADEQGQLRIGAIGVGNRGLDNLSFVSNQRIVALCDVDDIYLDLASKRYPNAKRFHDFRVMLDESPLDAVVVSTPNHTHFHAVWLALKKGLHVYCEKPLANSVHEVRLLMREAARRAVVTQTGNQHHNSIGYRRFVNWVRSGRLGKIREAHVWTNRPYWEQGIARPQEPMETPVNLHWDLWLGPAPQRPYHSIYHPLGWRGWWDFGGGALADMGPHLMDPIFAALDVKRVASVRAKAEGATAESGPKSSTIEYTLVIGEQLAPFRLTWYDGQHQPPEDVTKSKRPPPNGILLLADEGRLFAPQLGGAPIFAPVKNGAIKEPPFDSLVEIDHHQEWVQACLIGGRTSCPFSYGGRLTEACLLGNVAIRSASSEVLLWDSEQAHFTDRPQLDRFLKNKYRSGWEFD